MIRQIPLTQGKFATVDAVDFRSLFKHKWHAFKNNNCGWYARAKIGGKRVFMHNYLLGAKGVDHKDGDGLNNTRLNLRVATPTQNARNRRVKPSATSRYKGVYLFRPGVFRAMIGRDSKQVSVGFFPNEVDAAKAYDEAAKEFHGEFACLNFPEVNHGIVATCVASGICPVHRHAGLDCAPAGD